MIRSIFAVLFLLVLASVAQAQGLSLGFGASGGLNIPAVQDDQGTGTSFGLRAILRPISLVAFEANVNFAQYGDPELDIEGVTNDLEGSKVTAYGIDATLGGGAGPGFHPFLIGGFGMFDISRDQTAAFDEDGAQFGWTAGLGFGFGLGPSLSLDLRGRFNIIPTEGSSSHKSAFVLGGLNFYLGK